MAQRSDAQLSSEKEIIKTETLPEANTATRVGTMLENLIDSKINNNQKGAVNGVAPLNSSGQIDPSYLAPTHFRGYFTSLANLQAGVPTGSIGDYAIVDAGGSSDAQQYIWDAQDGWVAGATGGSASWGSIGGTITDQTDLSSALNGKQPLDTDLTAISALTPANDDFMQRKSGAWSNRTPAQVKTDLALTKSDVGLGNVDNTSDANKPVSTAQSTAINNAIATEVTNRNTAIQNAVTGLYDDRGNYNASTNLFPATGGSGSAGAVLKGDIWTITVAGTLGGTAVSPGDTVRALADTPGQTAGNWAINAASSGSTTPDASETVKGKVELATQAETDAGTDDLTVVTPLKLKTKIAKRRDVTANFSVTSADDQVTIVLESATGVTCTVNTIPANGFTSIINLGAGGISFVAGSGMTLQGVSSMNGGIGSAFLYFKTGAICVIQASGTSAPGSATWGSITGTLASQTDLNSALSARELIANKATNFSTVNDTLYPTVQAVKTYADALVVGIWDDRGNFSAAGGAYPSTGGSGTAGAILKGDIWTISVAGTLPTGQVVEVGDIVRALIDTPGNTQANWSIIQNNIGFVPENAANKGQASGYPALDSSSKLLPANIPQATETAVGGAELATQAETNTGTDDLRIVTPLKVKSKISARRDVTANFSVTSADDQVNVIVESASTVTCTVNTIPANGFVTIVNVGAGGINFTGSGVTIQGVTSLAGGVGSALLYFKTSTIVVIIGGNVTGSSSSQATETVAGIAELATQAEANAGTDDLRIITPLKLKTKVAVRRDVSATSFSITSADDQYTIVVDSASTVACTVNTIPANGFVSILNLGTGGINFTGSGVTIVGSTSLIAGPSTALIYFKTSSIAIIQVGGSNNYESISNRVTDFTSPNNTTYPTSQAVFNGLAAVAVSASQADKGMVEIATSTEALAGTQTGSSSAALAIRPDVLRLKLRANRTVTTGDTLIQNDSECVLYLNAPSGSPVLQIPTLVIDSYITVVNIGAASWTFANNGASITGLTSIQPGETVVVRYTSTTTVVITGSLAYQTLLNKPTTMEGFGITNSYTHLNTDLSTVNNSGSTETDLYSYTIGSGTIGILADSLELISAGTFAATVNAKTLRVKWGGTTIFDSGALSINTINTWRLSVLICCLGTNSQKCIVVLQTSSSVLVSTISYNTSSISTASSQILKVTGQGTATGDLIKEIGRIYKGGH